MLDRRSGRERWSSSHSHILHFPFLLRWFTLPWSYKENNVEKGSVYKGNWCYCFLRSLETGHVVQHWNFYDDTDENNSYDGSGHECFHFSQQRWFISSYNCKWVWDKMLLDKIVTLFLIYYTCSIVWIKLHGSLSLISTYQSDYLEPQMIKLFQYIGVLGGNVKNTDLKIFNKLGAFLSQLM